MNKRITAITAGLLAVTALAQSPKDKGYATIDRATAEAHIGFLASDELEGREAGYKSGRIAGNYVLAQLKSLGIQPWNGSSYVQPFEAYRIERQKKGSYQVHPDSIAKLNEGVHQKLNLRNIIGMIPGKKSDEYVIIGAHYDHIGMDPLLDVDQIYNGERHSAGAKCAFCVVGRGGERTARL